MQDATQCARCLTVLVRLTGFDLLAEVWFVTLKMAVLIRQFRRGEISPSAMCRFETRLQGLLSELGRRIVQWTLKGLEPDDRDLIPPQFLWNGEYYRRKNKSPLRNLNCLFGRIAFQRYCFQPLESAGKCLFPLEHQLGIVCGVATPALANLVGRGAADLTQRQLLEVLHSRNVMWGAGTLRKVIAAMSEMLSGHRHEAQVQQLLAWLKQASETAGKRMFTLSVGRDGIMIPMVKLNKYKEACTATVSVLDRLGQRLGTVYLAQMPEALQAMLTDDLTALIRDVLARWEGPLPRLVYVTDCGFHPTQYFEDILSQMPHPREKGVFLQWEWIVDYYHTCQYITALAEAIFGPGREAFAWAAKQRRVLKTKSGGIFRVLRSAGALLATRKLVGSVDAYSKAYRYLRERASKMDYRTYRRFCLPIGSGVTEAACKIVFTQRFKLSGMKWTLEGGADILRLRILTLSGIWSQVHTAALKTLPLPTPITPTDYVVTDQEINQKCAV
ncbi:MAG: hypothetical protein ACKV0T_28060 [Planctomycetales bacterium]